MFNAITLITLTGFFQGGEGKKRGSFKVHTENQNVQAGKKCWIKKITRGD